MAGLRSFDSNPGPEGNNIHYKKNTKM